MKLYVILFSKLAEVITLVTCVWGMPGLNLDQSDQTFSWFSSIPAGKCQSNTSNYAMTVSFHILSLFVLPFSTA
jgi:hypothetical protein